MDEIKQLEILEKELENIHKKQTNICSKDYIIGGRLKATLNIGGSIKLSNSSTSFVIHKDKLSILSWYLNEWGIKPKEIKLHFDAQGELPRHGQQPTTYTARKKNYP